MARRVLGRWLREQRQARGWDVPRMARMLAQAAGPARGELPSIDALRTYVRRWEHGGAGVSERYRLLYCTALAIQPAHFGTHPPQSLTPQSPALPAAPPGPGDAPPVPPGPGGGLPPGWWPVTITLTIGIPPTLPPGPAPGSVLPSAAKPPRPQTPAPGPPPP